MFRPHRDSADRLLRPDALARVHRLELVARGVVEGMIAGRHRSPHRGNSVEFAEHRQYAPGDSIRDLDWRVFGRSDRYYIKQYQEETNVRATLVLDASGSMGYTGTRSHSVDDQPVSKFDYAAYLTATLTHLLLHQQDAVGLVTFDSQVRRFIPARSRQSHRQVLLQEIADTAPGGDTGLAEVLHDVAQRSRRRGMTIILSDLFEDPQQLLDALHHFRYRRHEVLLFHILAAEELTFPFESISEFECLEGACDNLQIDPKAVRAEYLRRLKDHVQMVRDGCGRMEIDYVPVSTADPFDKALSDYLVRRSL